MKSGTFVILFHFMPKNFRNKHPFWDNFYESKTYNKYKDLKIDKWFPKASWRQQDLSIIKEFYSYLKSHFPNPIPPSLFFQGESGFLGEIADKWLTDILSGKSFYEKNKYYFTKTEAKQYFTCDWIEPEQIDQSGYMEFLEYYWNAKIKANELDLSANFFALKFRENSLSLISQDYFRFICLHKRAAANQNEIGDIFDFLLTRNNFEFNNLTWRQLRRLSEEWHEQIRTMRIGNRFKELAMEWKKSAIKDFSHTIEKNN